MPTPIVTLSLSVKDGHTLPFASYVVANCGRQHEQFDVVDPPKSDACASDNKQTYSPSGRVWRTGGPSSQQLHRDALTFIHSNACIGGGQ